MNNNEFERIVDRIQATWPAWKVEEGTVKIWFEELGQFRFKDILDVVIALGRTEKFAPSLSHIFGTLCKLNRIKPAAVSVTPQECAEDFAYMRGKGFQRATTDDGALIWEDEARTVFDKRRNCWRRKVDFVLDHLGAESVTRELKSLIKREGGAIPEWSELVARKGWVTAYRQKIDTLVDEVTAMGF